ncbi:MULTISPECIES: hypothetical protein [unclassified Herbaspirillum]|uniref:hypothetical protein n=1 Tax=unclassified Herbaspirillum TaxID=2624150 RepID=UPI001152CD84|nr:MULTISPECIES: hypothetical protein [unclassified Herbaspirillum]MBB5391061.1 hypothetical protein [Herbaspirillum sp. SJZ102]TQK13243.1 hypothetical protein FB599_0656 [Herbaspirillum sp. SJZ130]TQK15247.1 hypothetical protein FB598_0594 [Herbaspirillum sp. SJZ106]
MLVKTFNVKKSSGPQVGKKKICSAVEYLLREKDWKGNDREQKPEVLKTGRGGLEGFNKNVLNNHREFTYTSGVLSFTSKEWDTMTDERKEFVMDRFIENMLPGEAQERVPYAFIQHQDEIHFVVARAWELDSGKTMAFNVDPPPMMKNGRKSKYDPSKEHKLALQEVLNYELGFDRVEQNPFSVHKSKSDYLDENAHIHKFKHKLSSDIKDQVLTGMISNRKHLLNHLRDEYNLQAEKKYDKEGKEYLLVKPLDSGKHCPIDEPVRLYGQAFEEKANFEQLEKTAKRIDSEKLRGEHKLSKEDYEKKLQKMEKGKQQKDDFNKNKFGKKKLGRKHLYEKGPDGKKKIISGLAEKLRNSRNGMEDQIGGNPKALMKNAPKPPQPQQQKNEEGEQPDYVRINTEKRIQEEKNSLKLDELKVKEDNKKQVQNQPTDSKPQSSSKNSNSNSSSNSSQGSSPVTDQSTGTGQDIIQTIAVKELGIADIEAKAQEELSKNGLSNKYLKLKAQAIALRDEIDRLRTQANMPSLKSIQEEQQKKASSPFDMKMKPTPYDD